MKEFSNICICFCLQHKTQDQLVVACRLKCAAGLAEMENKRYKSAARYFIQASIDHCNFPDVSDLVLTNYKCFVFPTQLMSPHDVAVYGGLCALATYDRKDLHDKVLASRWLSVVLLGFLSSFLLW